MWNTCKPAPALSFLPQPFLCSGCKPANPVLTEVRTFCAPTIPPTPALTRPSARLPTPPGANRKPCKPYFLIGRWRNAALSPPVLDFRQEGPLSPGAMGSRNVRASPFCPTTTTGGDHHYRHNHHGGVAAVTMVMVVMVGAYCLHRRARRYFRWPMRAPDRSDGLRRNSYTCACARLMETFDTIRLIRQLVHSTYEPLRSFLDQGGFA